MSSERLQKIIAAAGVASRRKAEELITAGRVTVNGEVKNELGSKADPATDDIRVDGKPLSAEQHVYVLLHKPKGYVTTVTDPEGRPTVMDLVKAVPARVYPVGRLDYLSEGLLLLTNDGAMAAKLTHASTHVPKKYLVKVSGEPTDEQIQQLRDGVLLPAEQGNIHAAPGEGGRFGGEKRRSSTVKTAPAKIELSREGDNPWYEVTLNEGRNRQIRRMFDFIGHHVEKIKRVEYGPLKLDIENGEFRLLKPAEVTRLQQAAEGRHTAPRSRDERPRFSKPRRDQGPTRERGVYRDRSGFEKPRDERTRTARFNAEGQREAEPPPRENSRGARAPRERRDFATNRRSEGRPKFGGAPRGRSEGRSKFGGAPRARSEDRGRGRRDDSKPQFRGAPRERFSPRGETPREPSKRPFGASGDRRNPRSAPRRDEGRRAFGGPTRPPREGRDEGRRPEGRSNFRGAPRGDKKFGRGPEKPFDRRGKRPAPAERPGSRPGSFRKDFRPRPERPVSEREEPRSQEFVDGVAKRFAGKLESGGRGPKRSRPQGGSRGPAKGPRGGSKGRGTKPPFRKPKDRR